MKSRTVEMPRQRVGKFELLELLGKGACGTVYRALDTFSGAEVALKVLDTTLMTNPDFGQNNRRQFMNEASLAGKLQHPHIAGIIEASLEDASGYIAIEYVPGGTLTPYTEPGRLLPIEDVIEIAFKCCGALDYAFREGVIHRDVKPANLMLAGGTMVKVADFGAALLRRAENTQIADIGTPLYMSPEQVRSRELNHQSDQFSLGVVLYELLTGVRPFARKGLNAVFDAVVNAEPAPPSTHRAELDPELDRILMRMLQKSPANRYPGWAELALDLAGIGRLSRFKQAITDREKFSSLRAFPHLGGLSDADVWEIVHASQWRRVPSQEVIVREGDTGGSLMFLARGELKVTKQGRLLNLLRTGEYFGEMAYVKGGDMVRQATVEAVSDVLIAEFEPGSIQKLGKDCQLHLSLALMHTLVDRLALADERIVHA